MNTNYTKDNYLSFYRTMFLIRKTEESFVEPILDGTIKCPVHLYTGEEAVSTGLGAYMNKEDIIFGNHRSHGHYLAKGGGLEKMINEIYCLEDGCAKGRGGSMHIVAPEVRMLGAAPIVSGTISLALGAALSLKLKKQSNLAVAFFGDGATGEGVLFECLNFAALKKLPIIFACENNLYSTHLPIKEIRPDIPIYKIGEVFGMPSFQVDGNNLIETLNAAKVATEICRSGDGPVFIEFKTYRMRGHVGPSDNIQGTQTDIRPAKEVEEWRDRDPIKQFESYLISHEISTEKELEDIRKQVDKEIYSAHKKAKESKRPDAEELTKYVFK